MTKTTKQVTVIANGEIRHDGATYQADDEVTLDETSAQALIDAGSARLRGEKAAEKQQAERSTEKLPAEKPAKGGV